MKTLTTKDFDSTGPWLALWVEEGRGYMDHKFSTNPEVIKRWVAGLREHVDTSAEVMVVDVGPSIADWLAGQATP